MFAAIDIRNWPPGFEELEYLRHELNRWAFGYQVVCERKLFRGQLDDDEYQFVLLRWTDMPARGKGREVLLDTTNPVRMIETLRLLVSVEKEKVQEGIEQQP